MDASTPVPPASPSPRCKPAPQTIHIEFPHHSSSLLEALNRHRLEGKFCDVSLLVQGRELRAHKAVLAAASPYFHDKLLLGDAPRLTLPNVIEADAFEGLLQLIYSGSLHLPLDALPAHLLVASGLQMWQVVDRCSEILRELETSGGISAGGGASSLTLLSTTSSGGWCIRSSPFQNPVRASASTENSVGPERPAGGQGSEPEGVLQVQVKVEEEEEQGSAAPLFQTPQPERVSGGVSQACGSLPSPTSALPSKPSEDENSALDPPAPPVQASQVLYVSQENGECKEEMSGGKTPPGGAEEKTNVLPGGDSEEKGELRYLLSSGGGETSGAGDSSWKPVDLHGNEILSGGGGPGGPGQAMHGPVKLGGTPPADGKCFACLCGKRFAVKPKRDRHIMLTFSLRPFGCGICNKRFKLKHHLTEHMKTHARALHACPHCGRRFRVQAFFLRHRDLCKGQGWPTYHWTYK